MTFFILQLPDFRFQLINYSQLISHSHCREFCFIAAHCCGMIQIIARLSPRFVPSYFYWGAIG